MTTDSTSNARAQRVAQTRQLTSQGHTPEQIAEALGVALSTVYKYRVLTGDATRNRSINNPAPRPLNPNTRWADQALCLSHDGDIFFPDRGIPTREAKRVCRRCPVQGPCLEYALSNNEAFGVWGGLSERERRQLQRQTS